MVIILPYVGNKNTTLMKLPYVVKLFNTKLSFLNIRSSFSLIKTYQNEPFVFLSAWSRTYKHFFLNLLNETTNLALDQDGRLFLTVSWPLTKLTLTT